MMEKAQEMMFQGPRIMQAIETSPDIYRMEFEVPTTRKEAAELLTHHLLQHGVMSSDLEMLSSCAEHSDLINVVARNLPTTVYKRYQWKTDPIYTMESYDIHLHPGPHMADNYALEFDRAYEKPMFQWTPAIIPLHSGSYKVMVPMLQGYITDLEVTVSQQDKMLGLTATYFSKLGNEKQNIKWLVESLYKQTVPSDTERNRSPLAALMAGGRNSLMFRFSSPHVKGVAMALAGIRILQEQEDANNAGEGQ